MGLQVRSMRRYRLRGERPGGIEVLESLRGATCEWGVVTRSLLMGYVSRSEGMSSRAKGSCRRDMGDQGRIRRGDLKGLVMID